VGSIPNSKFFSGYDRLVKLSRFFLIVLYMGYLVNAGLMLIMLPWSRTWGVLLSRMPLASASVLDAPWIRGLLTAFGVLHLILVAWELINPTLLAPTTAVQNVSQNSNQS
jgi:hypothetical protein